MSLSFPVNVDLSQARAIGNSQFLVLTGEQLSKYSRDFQRLSSMATPLLRHGEPTEQQSGNITFWNSQYETWQMDVAPNGETVLLEHVPEPMHLTLSWLRSADFSEIQSMQTHTWIQISAGNKTAVAGNPIYGGLSLISPSKEVSLGSALDVGYLVSDSLFFIASQNNFKLIDTSGHIAAQGRLSISASPFARAMKSERFVYGTGAYDRAGVFPTEKFSGVHVSLRVFDWKKLQQIAEVKLHKEVGGVSSGYKQLAIALSPDGTLLAILDDSRLTCYRVP
jgi:hypothetical protein